MSWTPTIADRCRSILYPFALVLLCSTVSAQTSVLTQHNDLKRTGWDSTETELTQATISNGRFGKIFSRQVDDQIYAQPLVVSNVSIGGGTHNVVYVATVNNSVYAFDADDSTVTAPYWQVNLTYSGYRVPAYTDFTGKTPCGSSYTDFTGNIGIIGTPVIDPTTNTLYVVARSVSNDGTTWVQYLHALDISTGAEKNGGPVYITATYPGTGSGNVKGIITFDQQKQNQRPALLLYNGVVYISWASHCDWSPYQGWVIGYDANTLAQKYVYNTCANGVQAGIWMSGQGPSVDDSGYIYVATGNGTVGLKDGSNPNDTVNRGSSLIKLSTISGQLKVKDFFTPNNYNFINSKDLDYGTDGVLLLPNTNLSLSGSKEGVIYVMNNSALGGYTIDNSNVPETLSVNTSGTSFYRNLHGSPVYFKDNNNNEYVYAWASSTTTSNGYLKQFPFVRQAMLFDTLNTIVGNTALPVGRPGAMLSVSSNGTQAGTGILWASHPINGNANYYNVPGELQAFDATDVTHEIWNSNWSAKRDSIGTFAKFVCPTIANGKVYMATFSNTLNVYGMNPPAASPCTATLPSGWTSADIGYTPLAGDVCYDSVRKRYTITASGADLGGNVDAFHYLLRPTFGINYLDVRMRVINVQNTNANAKCGILFRQNLSPGSPYVFLSLTTGSNGIFAQKRITQDSPTIRSSWPSTGAVYWLRVVNTGNVYQSYSSPDGVTWTLLRNDTLALGSYPYVGLAYTSHNNSQLGTAVVDSFSVSLANGGTLDTDLLNLTAKNIQNKYAHLTWNWDNQNGAVDHFDIERSAATTDFEKIGSVNVTAGLKGIQNYSFDDMQPLDNGNYYRLKAVYNDGSYKYSPSQKVIFNFDVMHAYPNPAKNKIYIQNNIHFTGNASLKVALADVAGHIIFRRTLATGGTNSISITLPSNISQGMYILWLINASGEKQGQKLYIIR